MKELIFSPRSEAALDEIADWTRDRFGQRQVDRYLDALLAKCFQVAEGSARSRACRGYFADDLRHDLCFTRSGRHFIIFVETPHRIVIVDFIHQSADVLNRLGAPPE